MRTYVYVAILSFVNNNVPRMITTALCVTTMAVVLVRHDARYPRCVEILALSGRSGTA